MNRTNFTNSSYAYEFQPPSPDAYVAIFLVFILVFYAIDLVLLSAIYTSLKNEHFTCNNRCFASEAYERVARESKTRTEYWTSKDVWIMVLHQTKFLSSYIGIAICGTNFGMIGLFLLQFGAVNYRPGSPWYVVLILIASSTLATSLMTAAAVYISTKKYGNDEIAKSGKTQSQLLSLALYMRIVARIFYFSVFSAATCVAFSAYLELPIRNIVRVYLLAILIPAVLSSTKQAITLIKVRNTVKVVHRRRTSNTVASSMDQSHESASTIPRFNGRAKTKTFILTMWLLLAAFHIVLTYSVVILLLHPSTYAIPGYRDSMVWIRWVLLMTTGSYNIGISNHRLKMVRKLQKRLKAQATKISNLQSQNVKSLDVDSQASRLFA